MRRSIAAAFVLSVAAGTLTAQPAFTHGDAAAAIALGEKNAVEPNGLEPYRLRHTGRPDNPVVVAAVYTPFLRVAYMARAAAETGRHLRPADVQAEWTRPLAYIAFRWYCCDAADGPHAEALAAAEPEVAMLPIAPRAPQFVPVAPADLRGGLRPEWVRKGAAHLESFGATPPYDDIVVVAAFPIDALRPGRPFAIYKNVGGAQSIRIGVIRADDAAAWR